MDKLFEDALRSARYLGTEIGGMASVRVTWHPYKCHWEAEANWSDNTHLIGEGADSPTDALLVLIELMDEEKARREGR